ncbi:ARS binding protein Abp2 [Coccidioides immitis RS]|uniref:ARS binding protein Abp2 n=4 Tax=Coccidioides immitis TaxID=5501 RepID=J3K7S7_COCIM|nr:ARS binding protein Abp2 [Coccidioides immitis RS]EAS30785.3 ARS binding protein Abp2 [Coccidioides immitis RS]KMP03366.1 hypothetical protein CIRG_03058 [Coccidioides immitis RMSCC 2394]KMU84946.1 hypothetical protein CIHG_02729 [Coccidioides immitis H538.4]TPX23683.1 hypothetical protein DIZ76_013019 [Coccidioides immitis]
MEQHQSESTAGLMGTTPPSGSLSQGPFRTAMSPPLYRRSTPGSLQPSPRLPRSELIRRSHSAASMSPPVPVPVRQGELVQSIEPRTLPSRNITDATIDDAYVDFIFYCNPGVPSTTNTSELRRMFRLPPRSDGKCFSIYTLWELIQKLDRKEIKTWIQLAIELGVEPPSVEKKQSTQKVQQYAVRLKRWMRAMHVDAFFDYCMGNQHPYYTNVGALHDQDGGYRDGVPREEDLTLRALYPEWKPRKGRKRALAETNNPKRPRLDTQNPNIDSSDPYLPWSALPDDFEQHDHWTANSAFGTGNPAGDQRHNVTPADGARWDFPGPQRSSPLRYPQSAVTPRGSTQDAFFEREPKSAITPDFANRMHYKRRRDQPVLSPWAASRSIQPSGEGSQQPLESARDAGTAGTLHTQNAARCGPPQEADSDPSVLARVGVETSGNTVQDLTNSTLPPNSTGPRPVKLQLQVPKGSPRPPVRLATPQLQVNGEFRRPSASFETQDSGESNHRYTNNTQNTYLGHTDPLISCDNSTALSLDKVSRMFALEVQHARILGSPSAPSEKESVAITNAIIKQIKSQSAPNASSHMIALYCAVHLGLGQQLGLGGKRFGQLTIKITRGENREIDTAIPTPYTALDGISHGQPRMQCVLNYDLMLAPGITTKTTIHVSVPSLDTHDGGDSVGMDIHETDKVPRDTLRVAIDDSEDDLLLMETGVDWKQRYLSLKKQIRKRDTALRQYKKKILEVVMDDI